MRSPSSDSGAPAPGWAPRSVLARRAGQLARVEDRVAQETPIALIYNGEPHAVMMATPRDLEDFARGFSLSEGVIETLAEVQALDVIPLGFDPPREGYEIRLRIPPARHESLRARRRSLAGRTGCGLCGAESIAEALRAPRRVPAGERVTGAALARALAELRRCQPLNAATGATHAAAWATADGRLRCVREDVGRHNALDKLIGALYAAGADTARGFCVVTSRASYEMALKAAMAGMPMLAAISAPTDYAIAVAEAAGLTLVGFARGEDHVIYACPARIADSASAPVTEGAVAA
ncbi:MAG: formate dehydrogenase accessory sulfurtransferase FdhD [Sinobacteraceae bacterium]|nr:formate dehydrogenase accessory sulfurtransferase FdhD [Nevskia sp.]MDI3259854.1 formate dehydrogenase accessory sulfurtransferase FdhD [Nevskiaceae bacterium]